jgi:hypothetical protein
MVISIIKWNHVMSNKIIINSNETITCPHCEEQFALKDAIAHQLIEQHESDYQSMVNKELETIRVSALKDAEKTAAKSYQETISNLNEKLVESNESAVALKLRIEAEKKKVEEQTRESMSLESQSLKESLKAKDKQLAQFREEELELRKQKQALEERQKNADVELARKLDQEKQAISSKLSEDFKLKEGEWRKKIDDASKANDDLKRKLEQGSQQLQGEILELELESELAGAYPLDDIEPVKKGVNGADVLQTVRLRSGTVCGKIVWETKRAANWTNGWITKLKSDMQEAGGDIGVLVSTAFPVDVNEPFVQRDGIWLVKPAFVKSVSEALRTVLTEAQRQRAVSAGKNEQMEALYDYICSTQFVQRIKAVVDHQEQMRLELDKEKSAIQRIWKKREGQIGGITNQMMSICGELQGLSHGSMPLLDEIAPLDDVA